MQSVERLEIEPVGRVANGEDDVARQDWRGVESAIVLRDGLGEALLGLDGYSHVIVIGWLDRVPAELRARRRAYPAGDERLDAITPQQVADVVLGRLGS